MGGLELVYKRNPVGLPASAQRVLALVALRRRPLSRLYVAGQLWLDSSEERAGASLRSALWRLQRAADGVLETSGRELSLARWVEVDVDRFTALAHELVEGRRLGPAEVGELCGSDDLLPDWYEDWVGIERERFRQVRLHALETLCRRLTAEPLRESAHRAMIGMHIAEGNLVEAVRQYDACERLMSIALGVRPSRQIASLLADGVTARDAGRPPRV